MVKPWVSTCVQFIVLFSIYTRFITLRAKLSGAVYCYRSCLWACLQRAGGVRTLLQPARAVFAFLWALFHWRCFSSRTAFWPSYCQISTDLDKILYIPILL